MNPDHCGHLIIQGEGALAMGKEVEVNIAGVVAALALSWSRESIIGILMFYLG